MEIYLFFFNVTATTEIYTLSLHDALPICKRRPGRPRRRSPGPTQPPARSSACASCGRRSKRSTPMRSEEHTSELQSRQYRVCRLLLEIKYADFCSYSTWSQNRNGIKLRGR